MLVLARFVKRLLQEGGLDYRCVFLLSAQDEQLLGNPPKVVLPSGRRFSQPLMLTTPDGELEIPAGDLHGLFVAEFPFQPERGESDTPWFERSLTMRLVPGDWYWVLIEGAFGRLEPGIRNYATIDLNVKNVQVLVVHAGGLYPRLDPGEYSDACSAREQVTPGRAGLDPFARIMADRAAAGIDTGLPVTQEEVDWLVRAAGAVLGFPVSGDILAAGRELAASPVRPMLEAGLRRLYALWSASTGSEGLLRSRLREQVRKRQRSGSGSVLLGQPTVEIAVDLSNPGEFGASGPALLVDFAAQPYAMVGISDAPGSGPLREGSGVSLMLPFWACDLLAQALYPLPEPEREPLAQWRAAAVAAQSFRHLENRNVRAFVLHDPRGRPVDSGGRFEFDHTGEVRFESPAGSTVFAEPVVQVAMRRRAQETMRLQVHADAIAFFGDAGWPNPWPALAGFLGVKMYPLVTLQGPEGREAAIASVARPAMHPRQIEEPGTGTESFRFLTLTHRHDVEEQIARHVMAQDRLAREPRLDTGTGEPGILELPVPEIWRPGLVLQQQQNVLTPSQAEAWRMLARWPMAVTTGGPGAGKALTLNSRLLTPTGWIAMRDVQVGDLVIGRDGQPVPVLGVYPQGEQDIWRVRFSDGSSVDCTDDHLWLTSSRDQSRKAGGRSPVWAVRTLSEIRTTLLARDGATNHRIPMVSPIELGSPADEPLPLDPWFLGVLLGNGGLTQSVRLSSSDDETLAAVRDLLPDEHRLEKRHRPCDWAIVRKKGQRNTVWRVLKDLGLCGLRSVEKSIPRSYLFTSAANRLALLQGLLDTDGSAGGATVEYSTSSPRLAQDVRFLVESLGGTATTTSRSTSFTYRGERRTGQPSWRLLVNLPPDMPPFRLRRKLERYVPHTKYLPRRMIRSVEYVGREPAQCIEVGGEGLFLTDYCVVTHNTHFTRVLVHGLRELSNDSVWVMLLAPTNRAAARLAERVAPAARQGEPLLLGGRAERGTVKGPPNLIVGTVDAFIARFRNSRSFADALVTRDGVLVFDESGMLTMDRVAMVLELLDPPAALRSPTHTGRLLRTVFTGDTHQLGSVEPGDFLGDMQRFLPLVHLREAVRVMSGKDESPLGSIFSLVRAGLEDQNWRQAFVRWSLAHTPAGASVIARDQAALTRFRLPAPDNTPKSVFRVLMVDDLPERKPASDEDYSRWLVGAEERLRNTVFRAILQFRKVKLTTVNLDAQDPGAPIVPSAPLTATREQQNAVLVDYERMRLAFTRREPPFKVITLYRVPRSSSSQTVFFSSAERVNGWFHDFLTGRLPPPPGHWMPRVAEFAEDRVRADVDYSATLYAQEQGPEHSGPATLRFLAERRPHDLALVPNWPYIVKRNDFRQFGIFRGETIWHTGRIASRGETMCRFVSEVGAEMVVPVRFAQPRYLGYGWATNVHQVQGGEYPLVIMLWLEGVPWSGDNGLAAAWEELSPGMTAAEKVARAMQPLRTGDGQGDDRMGLDKFYTGITRTMAGWSLPVPDPETGEPRTQGSGQCVVVAGWYALRLYPGLSVQRRATGFAGTVRDMLDERP